MASENPSVYFPDELNTIIKEECVWADNSNEVPDNGPDIKEENSEIKIEFVEIKNELQEVPEDQESRRRISTRKKSLSKKYSANDDFIMKTTLKNENRNKKKKRTSTTRIKKVSTTAISIERATLNNLMQSMSLLNCHVCQKSHQTFTQLHKHMVKDHNLPKGYYICCGRKISVEAYDHMRYHRNNEAFKCKYCGSLHKSNHALKDHIKESCGIPKYKCLVCGELLTTKSALERHHLSHRDQTEKKLLDITTANIAEDPKSLKKIDKSTISKLLQALALLKCNMCQEDNPSYSDLKKHVKSVHQTDSYYIFCCNSKFWDVEVDEHMLYHINRDAFKCHDCDKLYLSGKRLNAHQEKFHEPENPTVFCEVCNRGFKTNFYLLDHLRKHYNTHPHLKLPINPRKYECEFCDRAFSNEIQRNKHVHEMHPIIKNYIPHVCEFCGKIFSCKRSLMNHVKLLHQAPSSNARFVCETCGKAFPSSDVLLKHVARKNKTCTSQGFKRRVPEECDICHKYFPRLEQHKRITHFHGRVPCDVCGKMYATGYMKRHAQQHKGLSTSHTADTVVAPIKLKCTDCNKEYSSKHGYASHIQTVHKGIREKCFYCPLDFVVAAAHMKVAHAKEYAEYLRQTARNS